MLKKIEGVVLRTTKYSETSVICDVYTKELGVRTYIMNGVRKKKSKVSPGLLRPMSLVEMVVYHHEEKDINRIKEVKPNYIYAKIPFDVSRGSIGLFITEVAQKTLKETEPNTALFGFLEHVYVLLDKTTCKINALPSWFLVHFANYLGLRPVIGNDLTSDSVFSYSDGQLLPERPTHHYYFSPTSTHLLAALLKLDYEDCTALEISAEDRRNFLSDMLRYYQYHIDNFGELNSIAVLQIVFA